MGPRSANRRLMFARGAENRNLKHFRPEPGGRQSIIEAFAHAAGKTQASVPRMQPNLVDLFAADLASCDRQNDGKQVSPLLIEQTRHGAPQLVGRSGRQMLPRIEPQNPIASDGFLAGIAGRGKAVLPGPASEDCTKLLSDLWCFVRRTGVENDNFARKSG